MLWESGDEATRDDWLHNNILFPTQADSSASSARELPPVIIDALSKMTEDPLYCRLNDHFLTIFEHETSTIVSRYSARPSLGHKPPTL